MDAGVGEGRRLRDRDLFCAAVIARRRAATTAGEEVVVGLWSSGSGKLPRVAHWGRSGGKGDGSVPHACDLFRYFDQIVTLL